MSPFLARRQYNTPILYIGVQRIACTDIEAAPKWPWKNDLSLRGNFGLHGKTILPSSRRFRNTAVGLRFSTGLADEVLPVSTPLLIETQDLSKEAHGKSLSSCGTVPNRSMMLRSDANVFGIAAPRFKKFSIGERPDCG
jgi:hypothetical protein